MKKGKNMRTTMTIHNTILAIFMTISCWNWKSSTLSGFFCAASSWMELTTSPSLFLNERTRQRRIDDDTNHKNKITRELFRKFFSVDSTTPLSTSSSSSSSCSVLAFVTHTKFVSSSSYNKQIESKKADTMCNYPTACAVHWNLCKYSFHALKGWVQASGTGEWEWEEDDPAFSNNAPTIVTQTISQEEEIVDSPKTISMVETKATPTLPSGSFRPKQSLGQNFLRDGNTVAKIVKTFLEDAQKGIILSKEKVNETHSTSSLDHQNDDDTTIRAVELGPGAGALTDTLVPIFLSKHTDPTNNNHTFQCIEIDPRSVELLTNKHPNLHIRYMDVLQANYPQIAHEAGGPLSIIGNLPYYITSQILFALADASHSDSVLSATVTMQYEVAQRIVAKPSTKEYGILSVVFQLYARCNLHYRIPPTVFYPQPKVMSALIGLHFFGSEIVKGRLGSHVKPSELRRVLKATFLKRRKTVRNGLKGLLKEIYGGDEQAMLEDENGQNIIDRILDMDPLPLEDSHERAKNEALVSVEAKQKGQKHKQKNKKLKFDDLDGVDTFALNRELPKDWTKKRPEELTPGQFVELTRIVFYYIHRDEMNGTNEKKDNKEDNQDDISLFLGKKVWRKLKHGHND